MSDRLALTTDQAKLKDATSGLTWDVMSQPVAVTHPPNICTAPARLPTSAEAVAIIVGLQGGGAGPVCNPVWDRRFALLAVGGDLQTSDGCIDLKTGASKASCTADSMGEYNIICVMPTM